VWTRSLIDGLLKYLTNRDSATLIVEVGVGSGIVPIVLNNQLAGDKWLEYIGLDINRVACEAAELNLQMNGESLRSNMLLQSDLLGELPEHLRGKVSIAVANLPQIPDRERSNTNVNDYYPLKDRRETLLHRFDQHGTGLLCNFLLAAIGVLSNDGSAILTMAGRCNIPEFNELFAYCGMSYHIASRIIIRQDPLTSIERFAEVEGTSAFRFTFYADGNGRRRISALDAMRAISQGKMVYHDLYVIVARPLQQGSGDYSICPI
jgi:methylase of polypeptide subunit release factors